MSKPSEQRGGTNVGSEEAREKGGWVENAAEGVVPAELGGSDAPDAKKGGVVEPEYSDAALGRTTGSDEPATSEGIDLSAGDNADATTDGGAPKTDDLRDAGQRSTNL